VDGSAEFEGALRLVPVVTFAGAEAEITRDTAGAGSAVTEVSSAATGDFEYAMVLITVSTVSITVAVVVIVVLVVLLLKTWSTGELAADNAGASVWVTTVVVVFIVLVVVLPIVGSTGGLGIVEAYCFHNYLTSLNLRILTIELVPGNET